MATTEVHIDQLGALWLVREKSGSRWALGFGGYGNPICTLVGDDGSFLIEPERPDGFRKLSPWKPGG